MANVALFLQNQPTVYLVSVNTGDYLKNPDALINPDISAVAAIPVKFWKRSGDIIVEMSDGEKQAILDTELAARKISAETLGVEIPTALSALVEIVNLRLSTDQKITQTELVNTLKTYIT